MLDISNERVRDFIRFIKARELHRKAKEAGLPAPRGYRDPIIAEYRFCNVRRNDDRVTKWIHKYVLTYPGSDLWFALAVARLFNNEDTLLTLMNAKCIVPFRSEAMRGALNKRKVAGLKNFNPAYIVSTNGRSMDKIDYVIDFVLAPMWSRRKEISKMVWVGQLANAHIALSSQNGLGSFMAAQILADLKYAPRPHVWEDFHTFAASGPGSRRGMNRLAERPVDTGFNEFAFRETLATLRDRVNVRLSKWEPITAQDIQNCLCEFDKYERVRLGEGTPKQLYRPKGDK